MVANLKVTGFTPQYDITILDKLLHTRDSSIIILHWLNGSNALCLEK